VKLDLLFLVCACVLPTPFPPIQLNFPISTPSSSSSHHRHLLLLPSPSFPASQNLFSSLLVIESISNIVTSRHLSRIRHKFRSQSGTTSEGGGHSLCDPAQNRRRGIVPSCSGRQKRRIVLLLPHSITLPLSGTSIAPLPGIRPPSPLPSGLAYRCADRIGKSYSRIPRGLEIHSTSAATRPHRTLTTSNYTLTSIQISISLSFLPPPYKPTP
jgi:hypothetical protein